MAKATGADAVFWNRRYEPASIARDRQVEEALRAAGLHTESCNGALLHEPWTIRNKAGRPFQVFTPFWRTCLASAEPAAPLPAPRRLAPPPRQPASLPLAALELEPKTQLDRRPARGLAARERRRQGRVAALPARRPPDLRRGPQPA